MMKLYIPKNHCAVQIHAIKLQAYGENSIRTITLKTLLVTY